MIQFQFSPHFSIRIVIAFVFFTAVGTILHEFGHQAVAEYFGYETKLSYGSVNYFHPGRNTDPIYIEYTKIWKENYESLRDEKSFPKKDRFLELVEILKIKYPTPKSHSIWIAAGGPIQTILSSFIGLFILFYRKSKDKEHFVLLDWIGVFLALFVLREVFNYVMSVYFKIFYTNPTLGNDEFKISSLLGLSRWVIPTLAMLLGLFICLYVIFRIIPLRYRFSFIVSGFVGGILGFFVWLRWLGPVLIP